MKNLTIFTNIVLFMFIFTQCQSNKIKEAVKEMNKRFPISNNGITVEKAEAVDGNTIKLYYAVEGSIFEIINPEAWQRLVPYTKSIGIALLQTNRDLYYLLIQLNANIIYDYKTTDGKHLFDYKITPEELKHEENNTSVYGSEISDIQTMCQVVIDAFKPQLPLIISEEDDVTLVDIYRENEKTLSFVYEIPKENMISSDLAELKEAVTENIANTPSIVSLIHSGIEIKYIYHDKTNGEDIGNVKITAEDL